MGNRRQAMKISSLNCRSLKKHIEDILSDGSLLKSDIICLQETWLQEDAISEDLQIPNFKLHLNSNGKGKGIAIYFKRSIFQHECDIKRENMQLTKFNSSELDIIVVYRSQQGNQKALNDAIDSLTNHKKPELIIGDFNFCYLDKSPSAVKQHLKGNHFKQLINEPTHIEGNLLDQAHLRDVKGALQCTAEVHSKYFTDHKALALIVTKGKKYDI